MAGATEFCMAAFADESWRHIPITLMNCLGGAGGRDFHNLIGTSRAVHSWFSTRFDPNFGNGDGVRPDDGAAEEGRRIIPGPRGRGGPPYDSAWMPFWRRLGPWLRGHRAAHRRPGNLSDWWRQGGSES